MELGALPRGFGPYLLLDRLGQGGMASVFLASRVGLGDVHQLSVIKTLRPQHASDDDYIARFKDEARTVVQLNHRNIAKVFDIGIIDGVYYMAMELIRGVDLSHLMDRAGGALPPAEAVYTIVETLEALDFAHRFRHPITGEPLHIVHRDISPHNVMVSYEGEVKLIDFGLSASRMKTAETAPQIVMGKLLYMAPEQARDDQVDARSDLYAVGIMLVELLSGRRYYQGMTKDDVWNRVGEGHRSPLLDALPAALQPVAERAIARDPDRRFPDAEAFRAALLAAAREMGWHAGPPEMRRTVARLMRDEEETLRHRIRDAVGLGSRAHPSPDAQDRTQITTIASVLGSQDSTSSGVGSGSTSTGEAGPSGEEALAPAPPLDEDGPAPDEPPPASLAPSAAPVVALGASEATEASPQAPLPPDRHPPRKPLRSDDAATLIVRPPDAPAATGRGSGRRLGVAAGALALLGGGALLWSFVASPDEVPPSFPVAGPPSPTSTATAASGLSRGPPVDVAIAEDDGASEDAGGPAPREGTAEPREPASGRPPTPSAEAPPAVESGAEDATPEPSSTRSRRRGRGREEGRSRSRPPRAAPTARRPAPPANESAALNLIYLEEHCGGVSCAARVLKQKSSVSKMTEQQLVDFGVKAARCARRCSQQE